MATAKKKKRNPNDATFRNINALKTRVAKLEAAMNALVGWVAEVTDMLSKPTKRK